MRKAVRCAWRCRLHDCGISFLTAKLNGYYAGEGLDVELIAMRAPTANLAVLSGSVEFSTVPLVGSTRRYAAEH